MADLIALAYSDEKSALSAEQEAQLLADDLLLQPDAIAAIVRRRDGTFKVTTSHHQVGAGASWGMLWAPLFGILFFVPFFGMAVGAGLGALFAKLEKSDIDKEFQRRVRDKLAPGTSALFLVVDRPPDAVLERLAPFGGTVIKSSLSTETEQALQDALHGETAIVAS